MLLAAGRLARFRACYGTVAIAGDGSAAIDAEARELLGVEVGDDASSPSAR